MITLHRKHIAIVSLLSLSSITVSLTVNAELLPRLGGEVLYDSERDITWLANANLASSHTFGVAGITIDGRMSFTTAVSWLTAMNTDGGTGYLGVSNWRLPSTLISDQSCTDDTLGTTIALDSIGYNCTGSEFGHLFYEVFDAVPGQSLQSSGDPMELSKFSNFESIAGLYWSGTDFPLDPINRAYDISFASGKQSIALKNTPSLFALIVRNGDVAPPTAVELITDLINLVITMNLKQGISNALDAKLENAIQSIEAANNNHIVAAINKVQSFLNHVDAQRGKHLTEEQADVLTSQAQEIIGTLSQ